MLVSFFLKKYNEENGRTIQIDSGAMKLLTEYHWPGNVRELENTIERMVVMAETSLVYKQDIMKMLMNFSSEEEGGDNSKAKEKGDLPFTVESVERTKIFQALNQSSGIQAKAAKLLGITPRQIGYKIKKYKIYTEMS